jgi:exosortase J
VASANHLVANSKFIQGIVAQWNGSFDATARQALPVHFVTSFYDDGISRQYDAESICSRSGCSDRDHASSHEGFSFTAPKLSDFTIAPGGNSLPILLRREWLDSEPTPSADLRARFEDDARLFMAQLDLRPLLVQDGSEL